MSAEERSGFRDLGFSKRHRLYGRDCPATNIDFLEYDEGQSVAVIEAKRERERFDEPNKKAIIDLSNRASLPAFKVVHADDFSIFTVSSLNPIARRFLKSKPGTMQESEFIRFLYAIRGRDVPEEILRKIEALKGSEP
jgi:hypothetical protein